MNEQNQNEQIVSELMNDMKWGILSQVFVIESLRFYSKIISESTPKDTNDMISQHTWKAIAEDVQQRLVATYEPKDQ